VASHTSTVVEPPDVVANLIRIGCVAITLGANIMGRERRLPEAPVPAAGAPFA
jgi:hypothetical protein